MLIPTLSGFRVAPFPPTSSGLFASAALGGSPSLSSTLRIFKENLEKSMVYAAPL